MTEQCSLIPWQALNFIHLVLLYRTNFRRNISKFIRKFFHNFPIRPTDTYTIRCMMYKFFLSIPRKKIKTDVAHNDPLMRMNGFKTYLKNTCNIHSARSFACFKNRYESSWLSMNEIIMKSVAVNSTSYFIPNHNLKSQNVNCLHAL